MSTSFGLTNLITKPPSNNISSLNIMDITFANNSGDSGYNSTNHTSHEFKHKLLGSVLHKIDEDIEQITNNISPVVSPLVTPTTASIKSMNALHLSSPIFLENTSLLRVPLKRSATKTESEVNCTPKKSKLPDSDNNENIHNGVRTPIHGFDTNNITSIVEKAKSTEFNLITSKNVTNVLKEKSINRMPFTRSLSTSTPKFSSNIRGLDNYNLKNVPKSASPCKKKRILKKFQSFSPISYLKTTNENGVPSCNEIELVKKRLSFFADRNDGNQISRKRQKITRQKAITIDDSIKDGTVGGAIKKMRSMNDPLKIINEECNDASLLDLPRNATIENDIWKDLSFSNTLDVENTKFSNLINAPILNTGSENDKNKINKEVCNKIDALNPYMQLSSIEAANSLSSNFIENNSCEDISVPSIHSYFDALNNTSILQSDSKETNKSTGLLNVSISLELNDEKCEADEMFKSPIKRRDSLSLIETLPNKTGNEFNNFEYEKNLILHPMLPKTPPKKTKTLRRLNSSRFAVHERKKLARSSYEGIERINILVHLENIKPALDIILNNLEGEDLVHVSMVSKKWKSIVDNNNKAKEKKMVHLKTVQPVKENIKKHKFSRTIIGKPFRPPFSLNNWSLMKNRSRNQASPPRSPSKFNENQSLVKTLRKDSKLSRCPRCNSFCEVISPKVPTSPIQCRKAFKSPRKCLFSLTDTPLNVKRASSFSTIEKQRQDASMCMLEVTRSNSWCPTNNDRSVKGNKSFFNISTITSTNSSGTTSLFDSVIFPLLTASDNSLNDSILITADTAVCHKCGYVFCNRCSNENHPNKNCSEIGSFSPERDDDNKPIRTSIIGSKQSKRNLKRLCD